MEWQVTIDNKTKMVDLPEGSTANDLVNRLDLHPDGVLVVNYSTFSRSHSEEIVKRAIYGC